MCRLMIEFIKNTESYIELQLNLLSENRTKFVAFQIGITEFCSAFYVKELEFKNNSTFY